MLNLARLMGRYENLCQGLWAECADTATKMENLAAKIDTDSPFCHFHKQDPVFLHSLYVFGEIAVIHDGQKLCSKLANCCNPCMFISYVNNHFSNTFKLLNLKTHQIWKLRDVKWIASSIENYIKNKPQTSPADTEDNDDDVHAWAQAHGMNMILDDDNDANLIALIKDVEEEANIAADDDNSVKEHNAVAHPMPAANKTIQAMQQLATFYNPTATNYIQDAASNNDTITTSNQLGRDRADAAEPDPDAKSNASLKTHDLEEDSSLTKHASAAIDYLPNFAFYTHHQVLVPASATKTLDFDDAFNHHILEPMTFDEAFNHEDPAQHAKWHAAIRKECKDMHSHGAWYKVKRSTIPQG